MSIISKDMSKMFESIQRWCLKRRRLAVFVLVFCLMFLIYQLLSLKRLNVQMTEQLSHSRENDFVAKHTLDDSQRHEESHQIESDLNINKNNDKKTSEQNIVNKSKVFGILGVLPQFAGLYRKTSDQFQCLSSKEQIPYEYINDDYCDCVDGTDEPSTNACPLNKFYCRTNSGKSDDYISSAKVNDGICDCCDGSDEYIDVSSPLKLTKSQIDTIKSAKRLVPTPPCPNYCSYY